MDNEDKVERQSSGREKKKGRRANVSVEIASTHPHTPTQHNKHKRCTVLHLSEDGLRGFCILNETRPVGDLFSEQKDLFLSETSLSGCRRCRLCRQVDIVSGQRTLPAGVQRLWLNFTFSLADLINDYSF